MTEKEVVFNLLKDFLVREPTEDEVNEHIAWVRSNQEENTKFQQENQLESS